MSERHKPHNGRDLGGHFRVRQVDVDEVLEDASGPDVIRDDVRLGGAVADTGQSAGFKAREIEHMIDENRDDVHRVANPRSSSNRGRRRR